MIVSYIPVTLGNDVVNIPVVFDDALYNREDDSVSFSNVTPSEGINKCNEWLESNRIYDRIRHINIPIPNTGWQTTQEYPISYAADCLLLKMPFTTYSFEYNGTGYVENQVSIGNFILSHTPTPYGTNQYLCRVNNQTYRFDRAHGTNTGDNALDSVGLKFIVLPDAGYSKSTIGDSVMRHVEIIITYDPSFSRATISLRVLQSSISALNNYPINELVDSESYNDPFTPNLTPGQPGAPSSSSQGGDGTGGGWGDFDYSSDGPQDKNPPNISTYDAGFCTLYAATQAQIKALADYMWADTGDFINNWKKLWANPMDAILGISLVPLSGLLTGVSTAVKVGNIATTVYMTRLSASIVRVDCGTLYITSQSLSHSFMDFPPYNQVELYLPYIGTVSISASDVIDKYLSISYLCDCLSGSCVAFVMSSGYTVATYSGNIAAAVPVTSGDFANIVFAALDYLKVGGQDVAAGIGGIMASKSGGGLGKARGIAETVSASASLVEHSFEIGQSILVPQITKGGPAGSTAGYMNHQKPFLIFNAPNVAAPENMNTYIGYAQYETKSLGSCSGFTKVAEIHYRGAGTEIERAEIENLLRAGVDL